MATPYVEVIAPDASPQFVDLTGEHSVVGSAITCQVVVERPGFAREHMLLSPRPDGCYVAIARGAPTPIVFNGQPLERGVLPWGSEVTVGNVRFLLHDGSVSRTLAQSAARSGKSANAGDKPTVSPVMIAAVLIAVPLAGYLFLANPQDDVPRANVPAPALFDPLERPCPQPDPQAARIMATESARQAVAKAERLPFSSQDGIEAVNRYAIAAACFRAVNDAPNAEVQLVAARALSARIEDDFHNHQFRLERALEQGRTEDALVETRLIKNLILHRSGPYLMWVTSLERRLAVQLDEAAGGGH